MALTLKDRCKQKIAANAGVGSVTLSTSVRGFKTISSALSNGDTSYFCLESANGDWEVFSGTYTASGTTISRDTVLASSNSGNKIDIGTSITFCYIVYPADKALYKDGSNRAVMGAGGIIFSDSSVQTTAATSPDLSPYLTIAAAASTYAALAGSYLDPAWITGLAWSKISGTPTTLLGYGITDSITSSVAAATYVPYTGATGEVNLGTNALTVGAITTSGDLKFTDATYDIGKSGATRPRDGWFSRKLNVGSGASIVDNTASGWGYALLFDGTNSGVENGQGSGLGLILRGNTVCLAANYLRGLYGSSNLVLGQTDGPYMQVGGAGVASTNNAYNRITTHSSDGLHVFNHTLTSAAKLGVYETWTSSTSFGAFQVKANTGAAYQIGSAIGSAGGTSRGMNFGVWDAAGTFTSYLTLTNTTTNSVTIGVAGSTSSLQVHNNGSNIYYNAEGHYFRSLSGGTAFFDITSGTVLARTNVVISQSVITSGSPTAFTITGAAHTTLATAEVTDGYFNAARTVNFTTTGGTVANQRTWRFTAPTFTAAAATTLTTTATVSISGPPVASTNVTATNAYALNVESGKIRAVGGLVVGTTDGFSSSLDIGNGLVQAWASGYSCLIMNFGGNPLSYHASWGSGGIQLQDRTAGFGWSSLNSNRIGFDAALYSPAANIVEQRIGTNAQTLRIYNTYTSSTSGEWAEFNWQTTTNVLRIGTNKGSAGGSARDVAIVHGGTVVANFLADRFYLGPIADSTATGGNVRGANAVDLQTLRSAASQVASGTAAFVIGSGNTGSGNYSVTTGIGNTCSAAGFVHGAGNTVSGDWCVAFGQFMTVSGANYGSLGSGYNCTVSPGTNKNGFAFGVSISVTGSSGFGSGIGAISDRHCQRSHSGGLFAAIGDAQQSVFVLRRKTTDATPVTLMLDGSTTRLTIPSGKILFADVIISGIKSDGSAAACYKRKVAIKNVGGTTSLVGSVETIGTDIEDSAGCDVTITADNTNDALDISVTGIAGETWRWLALVDAIELSYGT